MNTQAVDGGTAGTIEGASVINEGQFQGTLDAGSAEQSMLDLVVSMNQSQTQGYSKTQTMGLEGMMFGLEVTEGTNRNQPRLSDVSQTMDL